MNILLLLLGIKRNPSRIVAQLAKKFPVFYGTRRSIAVFTSSHPVSLRVILMSSSHLRHGLPDGLYPSDFPIKMYEFLVDPIRAKLPACLILPYLITLIIFYGACSFPQGEK
jgi:hypothetical protein